jgi:hypothetical protein
LEGISRISPYSFALLTKETCLTGKGLVFCELQTCGHTTKGIEQHVQWAMAAISAQPESRVLAHPIKIAAGNWTAGTGILPGNLTMITVAHWKDGRIAQ